uniref:P-loop containing nucleoside triphosphate hydrolase n=1 Tax=Tanacetum cinerariifolium TaxID=118510 RepID=A0A699T1B1_TANCI|nr:P-loop containing nucleoside triphosphate hydrolase [Tanacetum cinerariifolium]
MDKMTRERCLKKAGKMDFARVLVEFSAENDLPNVIEIEYPPLGNRPSRIGMLEVKNGQVFNDSGNFRRNIQGNNANRQMSKNYMGLKNSDGNAKHNNGVEWQKKNSKSNTGNGFA